MGKPIWAKWAQAYDVAQLHVNPFNSFRDVLSSRCTSSYGANGHKLRQFYRTSKAEKTCYGSWKSVYGLNSQVAIPLHNYMCRQFQRTSNGRNLFCGFSDMHSTMSGPRWCQIWKVIDPWICPYNANGQMIIKMHDWKNFHGIKME